MKRIAVLFVAALLVLSFGSAVMAEDSIKVGVVLPLTGTQAKFGEIEKNSFLLALEEINAETLHPVPIRSGGKECAGEARIATAHTRKL